MTSKREKTQELLKKLGYVELWVRPDSNVVIKLNEKSFDRIIQFEDGGYGHLESLSFDKLYSIK